jgi:hypothetical protein
VEAPPTNDDSAIPVLHPLTPSYEPDRHKVYFDVIEEALAWHGDKKVRNIALTGSYGVGKSSILKQVADKHAKKLIQVSLSTLGFEPAVDRRTEAAQSDDDEASTSNPLRDTTTNRIQKEVVKQLLYTQMPSKTPGSRYRRTSAFSFGREVLTALVIGLPFAVAFYLLGWTEKVAGLLLVPAEWTLLSNAGAYLACGIFVYLIRFAFHNKLRIDSVSTGAATITLSASSDTYFDEYLDEIVYFFEVVEADIVIFEDIDRFEDAHIFETLRELNTILNGAKQLRGRTIRFIYAIKDSIFEELGVRAAIEESADPDDQTIDAAILELARANRTKFFDLVIPVVPFITHQSARELMASELTDLSHSVSEDLIDLVAQHVADMRLIKNIRNEFVIFHRQVIAKSSLELDDDHLFAMMLYKSTHLSDFELIKLGTSNLDELYRSSRRIVDEQTTRLNREIRAARRRLNTTTGLEARSKRFGQAVTEHVDQTMGHFSNMSLIGIEYNNAPVASSELGSVAFWRNYADGVEDLTFRYNNPWTGREVRSDLPRDEVEKIIGEAIDAERWRATSRADINAEIDSAQLKLNSLATADMKELLDLDEFTLRYRGSQPLTFQKLADRLLGSQLARDLLEQGYIDRYFTLYTSTFVGVKISPNAMNFILKNVDIGTMDLYFPLSAAEAKAVVNERRRMVIRTSAAYNLDLIDYLLENDSSALTTVLSRLRRFGEEERRFLQAYFASGRDVRPLASALAGAWRSILTFTVESPDLEPNQRLGAVNAALANLNKDLEYEANPPVGQYVRENYAQLEVFSDDSTDAATAELIVKMIGTADVLLPDLKPLGAAMQAAVVDSQLYELSRRNLKTAIAPAKDLALDNLKAVSPVVYQRVLQELRTYVAILDETELSIADPATFNAVLEDVLEADRESVDPIVARSEANCRVNDLTSISGGAWPALVKYNRVPATFDNVAKYIEEFGLDINLASILVAGQIVVPDTAEELQKLELANQLLASKSVIPSPELRAALIESLELSEHIDPASIPLENGEWIGQLIGHAVIADSLESFSLIGDDWDGLEFAVTQSADFASFVEPSIVTPKLMARFLSSLKVEEPVKIRVVEQFTAFAESGTRESLTAMARYALAHDIKVTWDGVLQLANSRIDKALILPLVKRFLANLELPHFQAILPSLGGDYITLLTRNGKHPRFVNNADNQALVTRLRELGTVNSFKEEGSYLRVHMKKPE